MKLICKAQNYGLNRKATGFLQIINNYKDIHNFKNGGIALFNHHFLNGDSLTNVANLIEKGAKGFISFKITRLDHGCIAAKEMGYSFYNIAEEDNNILSYDNKIISMKNDKVFFGKSLIKKNNKKYYNIKTNHKVKINLGFPSLIRIENRVSELSDGVGFSRIEFLLSQILKNIHPKKYIALNGLQKFSKEIANHLRPAVKSFFKKKKEYWIRTDDFSSEQLINMEFGKDFEISEKNSSTGFRGIRRSIKDKDFIIPQFKAIKILYNEGYNNIGIFPPMTNSLDEFKEWLKIAKSCGLNKVKKGLMVETPRSALMIEEFLEHIDFVVFGTNDLTSFLLSVDREDSQVRHLFNEHDKVVHKVLKDVIKKCKEKNIETYIGGQIADNQKFISKLLPVGLSGVSVNPDLETITKIKKFFKKIEKN